MGGTDENRKKSGPSVHRQIGINRIVLWLILNGSIIVWFELNEKIKPDLTNIANWVRYLTTNKNGVLGTANGYDLEANSEKCFSIAHRS